MLDMIPPAVLLLLSGAITVSIKPRLRSLPHWPLVVTCLVAASTYGLGTLLFLLFGPPVVPNGPPKTEVIVGWVPGVALASVGTLLIPSAVVFVLVRNRLARGTLVLLGVAGWLMIWVPPLRPLGEWNFRMSELVVTPYLALAITLVAIGLRRKPDGPYSVRIGVFMLPFLMIALTYLLLKDDQTRRPVASTCLQSGSMVLLLMLLGKQPVEARLPSQRYTVLLQMLLLAVGAILTLVLAANLKIFPKEPGPVLVAAMVATGLALAYGTLRPTFDLLMRQAISPAAAQAETRLRELQGELESTRERLREAEHLSLVGQLAAQVAHEIKNPLGPIKGYTKVIEREILKAGALSEVVQRGIGIIRQEVDVIDARAHGLLQLARPPQPRLEDLDYVSVGQDVIDLSRGDCPPNVSIGWSAEPAPPNALPGRADPVLLRGALLNAARNAIQALSTRGTAGTVRLSLREGEAGWELWVEDDGPGLPEEDPERLFRPFVTHREGGNGLGLVIARGNMRAMGGDLSLAQRAEGGARACFVLPREGAVPESSAAPESAAAPEPEPAAGTEPESPAEEEVSS